MTIVSTGSYTVSATMVIWLTPEKRWALRQALRERGVAASLDCDLDCHLLYLDLLHLAHFSLELVDLMQKWNCTIQWGYRVDGFIEKEAAQAFLKSLSLSRRDATWWPDQHTLILPQSGGSLYQQLQGANIPFTRQKVDRESALASQVCRMIDDSASEPLPQPEQRLPTDTYAEGYPLVWSPDSRRFLCSREQEGGKDSLILVDRKGGKEQELISLQWLWHHHKVNTCFLKGGAWSPDGKLFAHRFLQKHTSALR